MSQLTITYTPLDKAPSFEALAYTWGTGEADCKIPIKDHGKDCSAFLRLTNSLGVALSYIPWHLIKGYIWIDQIYINQTPNDDDTEKGQQIRLMKDIYATATRVLIWFGEGTSRKGARQSLR